VQYELRPGNFEWDQQFLLVRSEIIWTAIDNFSAKYYQDSIIIEP
jgi:hypothetical protein